jgi:hypothetical protein
MHHVSDDQRRARLAVRHALAPSAHVASPEAATRAMTVMHATEPATVYLSYWARVASVSLAQIDRALYTDRSLVKQLAMRRTLFVFPRDLLPAVIPSASARVAATERTRMAKELVAAGIAGDGGSWLDRARSEILSTLANARDGLTALELRRAVPMIDIKVAGSGGALWGAPQILTQLGAAGDIVRATNTSHWRTARLRWTLPERWLGTDHPGQSRPTEPGPGATPSHLTPAEGYSELVRRWLYSFGPGTEADLVWWLGATKSIVRAALADVDAVAVSLDGGATGWLLPNDLNDVPDPEPWVALLPVLDPTVMGWRERSFFLGPHSDQLFEQRGNAGTTAWVNGSVVGCWVHDHSGAVRVHLLEPVSAEARRALDAEARRLTEWLAGERVATGYMSPAMKTASS